jgi:monoamine oxidase
MCANALDQFNTATQKHLIEIRDSVVEADCQTLDAWRPQDKDLDALTFEAYLISRGADKTALATATVWTRAMLGVNPSDLSALFFLNYCKSGGGLLAMRSDRKGGGQHLRVRQGTQLFANGLADTLPRGTILLNTPVRTVTQQRSNQQQGVHVQTTNEMMGFRPAKSSQQYPAPC